jgi:hypothetical protein
MREKIKEKKKKDPHTLQHVQAPHQEKGLTKKYQMPPRKTTFGHGRNCTRRQITNEFLHTLAHTIHVSSFLSLHVDPSPF